MRKTLRDLQEQRLNMARKLVQRKGVALRATFAFVLLNLPLMFTAFLCYYLAGGESSEWWVRGIVALMVAVGEFWIVVETIGPPLREWIRGEEWVDEN